ncbi:MAG: toll/interleukin-1 receptor domain-containing protein [Mobilitalea sp.]
MAEGSKKVFISYSWSVQERVIELSERLIANSIDVVLDVYDLKEGQDKYAFMELSVNDPSVDRVLVISDKTYTEKANNRSGGVGDETVIISPEIYGQIKQEKFIPIIFEVDEEGKAYCPSYIKSRIYIDLSTEDDRYEVEYEKLLRNIYEKPLYKKPALGKKPEWLENDTVDLSVIRDLIKQVRGYTGGNRIKADFLLRKAADEFVEIAKQYTLSEDKPIDEELLQVIDQLKGYRDLFIDYCESLIYSALPISETISSMIERLYNELHDATGKGSYSNTDFELYDFLIWELFISITAILLHYEKYSELHNILLHTYFLRESNFSNTVKACNYTKFRAFCRTIEETCKKKCSNPNMFTLMGDILVKREKKPILTKETLANADLILYQLFGVLDINGEGHGYWYPLAYVYHENLQPIWQRLKSVQFCNAIQPLFGVSNITELKDIISKGKVERDMRYRGCFEAPLSILNNIKIEEIGSMN